MIGIDSNVLMRLLVEDDERQLAKARDFVRSHPEAHSILINSGVLLETLWLLRSRFRFGAEDLLSVVRDLLDAREFAHERRDAVEHAWNVATATGASFPDCFIASLNLTNGCSTTVTFDRDAAKFIPGMDLLA